MDYHKLYTALAEDLRKVNKAHNEAATRGCGRGDPEWKTDSRICGTIERIIERAKDRENLEYCEAHGYGKRISA